VTPTKAEEYRGRAEECRLKAESSVLPQDKERRLTFASAWQTMAENAA